MKLLECKALTKYYSGKCALNEIDLTIESGKIVGLLGPNGSGKSTLIKLIAGLLTPSKGELTVLGNPVGVGTKKIISYLPDKDYISDWMKIEEIVRMFEEFYEDFDSKRAFEMLNKLNLDKSAKLKQLSKGNKEKVQLILVMSRRAKLYLLDEPIGGVDPAARDYILNTIISNYEPEATVVIATHLIADIEQVLDEVIFIHQGKIALQSTVDEIREKEGKSVDSLFREVYKC
ncbi:MAG: ABC transporter ATP-binding protein [Firmicutes bacterium]|uniref:ABC transporter ATP-binding protein n=1 Tax=Candidatus Scybalomonas excrementavium TaxID=2840943 RepID=A0A9D9HYT4_9FIRM|nr:ABC transporter ATP-binding protein [Candidatus Scybalomonas excrementavium]